MSSLFLDEFSALLQYSKSIKFEDEPEYSYVRDAFHKVAVKRGISLDNAFDWNSNKAAILKFGLGQSAVTGTSECKEEIKQQAQSTSILQKKVSGSIEQTNITTTAVQQPPPKDKKDKTGLVKYKEKKDKCDVL